MFGVDRLESLWYSIGTDKNKLSPSAILQRYGKPSSEFFRAFFIPDSKIKSIKGDPTMRQRIYNPNTTHSNKYYLSVLNVLIAGNRDDLSYKQIAEQLNTLEIKTSAGLTWSSENVKGVLRKLRLSREFPSKIHHALLELILAGELELKATMPLFQSRLHGIM